MVVHSDWDVAEEEEVADTPTRLLSSLLQWDEIHRPPPDAAISSPPNISRSMVAVRNYQNHKNSDPLIIFPPINHENLQISSDPPLIPKQIAQIYKNNGSINSPPNNQQISYSDSISDSGSDSDSITNSNSYSRLSPSDSSLAVHCPLFSSPRTRPATTWFDAWMEIVQSKVNGIWRFLWGNFASSRGMFLTFRSAAITAMLLVFLYLRQRRRLRVDEVSRARLVSIIKEKDEKINQLLDQISRMNQVLLAHYGVSSKSPTT